LAKLFASRMDLKAFLQLSCQLVDKSKAVVRIQGYDVTFETTPQGWQISTVVCSRGQVPLSLLSSIALSRVYVFEKQGVFLKRNSTTGTLSLSKRTIPLNQFEDFQKVVQTFIHLCDEWKSLIEEQHFHLNDFSLKEG